VVLTPPHRAINGEKKLDPFIARYLIKLCIIQVFLVPGAVGMSYLQTRAARVVVFVGSVVLGSCVGILLACRPESIW
jgi:hypothetical protein